MYEKKTPNLRIDSKQFKILEKICSETWYYLKTTSIEPLLEIKNNQILLQRDRRQLVTWDISGQYFNVFTKIQALTWVRGCTVCWREQK